MPCYRVVIPYGTALERNTGHIMRFVAQLGCENADAARRRAVLGFRDLSAATGHAGDVELHEQDVLFEETEMRTDVKLEMRALEVRPTVFGMDLWGPLDSLTALRLDKEVYRLQRYGAKELIMDLSQVKPLGTAGLGLLLNLNDRLTLKLVHVPDAARKMMQTLGLEPTLRLYETYEKALKAKGNTDVGIA
ncbi:MAG: STAS domain-containing protein [Planctomycetota bacterium]|nr:STAS domain-containing protein [Planctomycetota bacterium]